VKTIFNEYKAQSVHTHPTSGEYWHEDTLKTLRRHAPAALVLQVCGYNDDGADRTQEQWEDIIDYATKNQTAVVLDSAYLGLANGPQQDRYPIERFVSSGLLTFICFSASKNLGLYNERVGALFVANAKKQLGAELAGNLDGVIKRIIRSSVSNTPLHAASAAASALANPSYYEELDSVRTELNSNRDRLHAILKDRFPHIGAGRGLFTKLFKDGFTPAQQQTLEAEGILTLPNSRINIGGMTPAQTVRFGEAVMQLI
jgi:aspartate/tyrosine/aromatic aminotransferase